MQGTPYGHWTLQPPQLFGSCWMLTHWQAPPTVRQADVPLQARQPAGQGAVCQGLRQSPSRHSVPGGQTVTPGVHGVTAYASARCERGSKDVMTAVARPTPSRPKTCVGGLAKVRRCPSPGGRASAPCLPRRALSLTCAVSIEGRARSGARSGGERIAVKDYRQCYHPTTST